MKQEDLQKIYDFLKEINKFKVINRLSLVEQSGRRESDAEHTWHLVVFVWLCSSSFEKEINLLKAIKLALVHDLVEIYAGDIYGGATEEIRADKKEQEKLAAEKLFSQLPQNLYQEFLNLWEEYEQRETLEAQYVWALDKITPRFQLAITKTDLAENLPTDHEKLKMQEDKISQISPVLGEIINKIKKNREEQF